MKQQMRDLVSGELTLDYFTQRLAAGWKIAAVEWVRDDAGASAPSEMASIFAGGEHASVPFGLQLSATASGLEENPWEARVLLLILEQIVKERRVTEIANELNLAGYRTREGAVWSATAVFNLLPRLIEVGPSVLKSAAWTERRATGQRSN